MSNYKYFTPNELKCKCEKCGSTGSEMDAELMGKIELLRDKCAFPFVVTSAYRCPAHNDKVSSTGLSGVHTTGLAIDIAVRGVRAHKFLEEAFKIGFSGIGVAQKGESRFIHLDDANETDHLRPWVWSY